MRTNVVLDESLLIQAKELTGIKTTRQVIHEALEILVRFRKQADVRTLRGKLNWEGDLEKLREGRSGDTS
jgi:Arc/MetJ family transcription regulator